MGLTSGSEAGLLCAPVGLEIDFCGERLTVPGSGPYTIGAAAELNLDVRSSLPDVLLQLRRVDGIWLMAQVAAGPEVQLIGPDGLWAAALHPGRVVPLVFGRQVVRIAARGAYELELFVSDPVLCPRRAHESDPLTSWSVADRDGYDGHSGADGVGIAGSSPDPRLGVVRLTPEQRVLLTVLAAPVLRDGDVALSDIPSSVQAARLLGWPVTKFNRKLDTVCARLSGAGFGGLHGGSNRPALNRRTRLVQIAVTSGLVGPDDLQLLDGNGSPR